MSVDKTEILLGKYFDDELERIRQDFGRVGETFINEAREQRTYKDRTGNLRSSIGYAIGLNGGSPEVNQQAALTLHGGEGHSKGQQYGNQLIFEDNTKGLVLVGYAGMEYAKDVEARKFDVITAASKRAARRLRAIMKPRI
jgi:hypothetical protein